MNFRFSQRPKDFTLNTASPLARGLVFAGLGRMVGSTQYFDSSLRRNHGTLTGFTGAGNTPPERWGRANGRATLSFPGLANVNGPISGATFTLASAGTISTWIITNSSTQANCVIFDNGGIWSDTNSWGFYISASILFVEIAGASAQKHVSTAIPTIGVPTHLCGTWDGTTLSLYVNGILKGTVAQAGVTPSPSAASIVKPGGSTGGGGTRIIGSLADAGIWNYCLPASLIAPQANPANVMLEVGGIPLLVPVGGRRRYAAPAAGKFRLIDGRDSRLIDGALAS